MSVAGRPDRRASPRTAVVWDVLDPVLAGPALDVVDIGGGTGTSAVRVAETLAAGGGRHRVTVVDPSPDALAALGRRAREAGVDVDGHQGDLADLPALVGADGADLVLCHGVLEVAPDPAAALAAIRTVLRAGGRLSLLVAQHHAAVVARAMAGHFAQARALLDVSASADAGGGDASRDPRGRAVRRYTDEQAVDLLMASGFEVAEVRGVRVFADLVPGSLLDLEPGAAAALVDLERDVATRPAYRPLAAQLHLLAT